MPRQKRLSELAESADSPQKKKPTAAAAAAAAEAEAAKAAEEAPAWAASLFKEVTAMRENFTAMREEMGEKFTAMREEVGEKFTAMGKEMGEVRENVGRLCEQGNRREVSKTFGGPWARNFHAQNLYDLAALATIPELTENFDVKEARRFMRRENESKLAAAVKCEVGNFITFFCDKYKDLLCDLAKGNWTDRDLGVLREWAKEQKKGDVPNEQLKKRLLGALQVSDPGKIAAFCDAACVVLKRKDAAEKFARDGSKDPNEYARSRCSLVFQRIAEYERQTDEEKRQSELVTCKGLGFCVATWLALDKKQTFNELELDFRGKVSAQIPKTKSEAFAIIEVGENKSGKHLVYAQSQLVIRLCVLRWAIKTIYGIDENHIHGRGHVFCSKTSVIPSHRPQQPWISISFHRL